jgi:hypothetical protein
VVVVVNWDACIDGSGDIETDQMVKIELGDTKMDGIVQKELGTLKRVKLIFFGGR